MWSRLNLLGMRRRWASQDSDPGRVARQDAARNTGPGSLTGRSTGADSVRPAFLARDVVIDCPRTGCPGKILTARRDFAESGGTASRVVLRCTREPEEHELAITIEPFSAEEKEELRARQQRGDDLPCRRCGTTMEHRTVRVPDAWTDSVSQEEAYACPWCGVKWLVPAELKCHQAG